MRKQLLYLLIAAFLLSVSSSHASRIVVPDTLVKSQAVRQQFQDHGNSVSNLALTLGVGSFLGTLWGFVSLGSLNSDSAPFILAIGLVLGLGAMITGISGSWDYLRNAERYDIPDKNIRPVKRKFGFALFMAILVSTISSIIVIAIASF